MFYNTIELPVQGSQGASTVPPIIVCLGSPGVLHVTGDAGTPQHLAGLHLAAAPRSREAGVAVPLRAVVPENGTVLFSGDSWDVIVYVLVDTCF